MWVKDEKIQIDPRCRQLVSQMKSAIWNRTRKGFERNSDGHSDLVAALVYLVRLAPVRENPYPALQEGISQATHHIDPSLLGVQPGGSAKQLAKLFGRAN